MTKKEAIHFLYQIADEIQSFLDKTSSPKGQWTSHKRLEALSMAISALDEPIDRCKSCPLCQSDKIRHKQESVHNDPLVLDELRQMRGEPVWCKELECYGIVKMEKVGSWANELFLVGTWHNGDAAVNFEYDIKSRGLTLYRHKPEEGAV